MSELLGSPHDDFAGRLLAFAARLGIPSAERMRRIRRKRFLHQVKDGDPVRWVERIRSCPEGAHLAEHLTTWCEEDTLKIPHPARPFAPDETRATVVINTVDRARDLETTLRDLAAGWDARRDELVIVLGPTADDSESVIRGAAVSATLVRCDERNLAVSRNLGLDAARGTFVVFLDDDASPSGGWLENLLAPFENPGTGVVAGFVQDSTAERFLNRYVVADLLGQAWWHEDRASATARIAEEPPGRRFLTATGCNMAFRREALCGIGGFDPFYRYFLEETDAVLRLLRAGWACEAAPGSLVRHRLGGNIARTPDFSPEQRGTIIRSQLHYIAKFARGKLPAEVVETAVWRRVAADLEKIAWDGPSVPAREPQLAYLVALANELA